MKPEEKEKTLKDMLEESAAWPYEVDGTSLRGAFTCSCSAQRNGPYVSAAVFSSVLKPGSEPRVAAIVVAAFLYKTWPQKCTELFGERLRVLNKRTHLTEDAVHWHNHSDRKMLRAVENVLKDESARYNPALAQLVANLQEKVRNLASPVELFMRDLRGPLHSAIKKGASRDDLIQMVDEAIAESVHAS